MKRFAISAFIQATLFFAVPQAWSQRLIDDTVLHFPAPSDSAAHVPPPSEDPYVFTVIDSEPRPLIDPESLLHYPEIARKNHWEGRVFLRFKVLKSGAVGEVLVEKGARPILNDAAVDAIKRCRFVPAKVKGEAVDCWTSQELRFKLH